MHVVAAIHCGPGRQRGRNARSNELVTPPSEDVIRTALGGLCRHELFVTLRLQDLPELNAGLTATRSLTGVVRSVRKLGRLRKFPERGPGSCSGQSAELRLERSRRARLQGPFGSIPRRRPLDLLAFGASRAQPLAFQREVPEQGRIASEAASSRVASRLTDQLVFGVTQHAAFLGPILYAAAASRLVVGVVDDRCMSSRRGWRVTAARISPRDLT
jgi:hypothetical protein